MSDHSGNELLKYAAKTFAETVALKVKQLRNCVPKEKHLTNPDLTGRYIEELVRGFVRRWIGHQQLLHGTFFPEPRRGTREKPLQVDGIVYDPNCGPVTLQEGDFVIVHPAFCSGVIEVKTTLKIGGIDDLEHDLQKIHERYFAEGVPTTPRCHIMGVVIADKDPGRVSKRRSGADPYYTYWSGGLCPIFVLFKETEDLQYLPFPPAIEAMIHAIYRNMRTHTALFV
jgi:hypothetical protein